MTGLTPGPTPDALNSVNVAQVVGQMSLRNYESAVIVTATVEQKCRRVALRSAGPLLESVSMHIMMSARSRHAWLVATGSHVVSFVARC